MKVLVVYGGESPEAEVSRKSARSVIESLKRLGHEVIPVELSRNFPEMVKEIEPDVVFISLHGSPGEDGTVQGLLEIMKVPYTGSGVIPSAVSIDKDLTKRVLKSYGIPVPSGITLFKGDEIPKNLEFPCIVKPARAGSSVGVFLVKGEGELPKALKEAFSYDSKVLIEEYLPGREVTVAVLRGRALPPVEIVPAGEFYDYESKYVSSSTEYRIPASLPKRLEERLKKLSERVYKVLECRGAIRVDFKLDNFNSPYVLEVNTIPGLTERSLLPKSAQVSGYTFDRLMEEILRDAEKGSF